MITLYRGDDTGGQLGKNVKIAFHCDDAVDMNGITVRFNLLNVITKEWTNVHDGDILEMFVTHEQSGKLPLGFLFGKIWGEDSSGKVRTFANRLPIIVTHDLRKVYGSDGLDSQDIHVYSSVDWDAIANKPTLFPSKIELVDGLTEALDGMVKSINGKTADAAGAVTLTLDSFANKDGEIQVKQTLMVSRDGGQTFNAVATLVDVWNEIDSHNSSATAHANLMAAIASTYARKSTTYTKTEVDDKINQFAAHYLTADADGSAFATVSALTGATAYYYAGTVVSPTKNDYAIVLDDDGKTARWAFFGEEETGVWQRQYYINSTSFTDDQWAAINSGIKDYLVPKILTIDESTATKKIVLGDKTFTSFAELTALVQNGVTRLKYYVTGAAGRPVLYTAHLCDASAIRFDATGTLGETVYTRSIAITKDGDDGIAVSVGTLTQVAKKSDIAEISTTFTSADAGKAADAKAVGEALAGKADTDGVDSVWQIHSIADFGTREYPVELHSDYKDGVTSLRIVINDGMTNKEYAFPVPDYESGKDTLKDVVAMLSDITAATKLTPVFDADGRVTGYKLGDKSSPVLLTDDAKAALFAGADFSRACAYKIVTVGANGMMTDRAINATSAASVTVPDDYTDLLIRASVTGSLSVTFPDGATKYGDAFPGEAGEYLITITKTGASEAYVRTIKLEVANA